MTPAMIVVIVIVIVIVEDVPIVVNHDESLVHDDLVPESSIGVCK